MIGYDHPLYLSNVSLSRRTEALTPSLVKQGIALPMSLSLMHLIRSGSLAKLLSSLNSRGGMFLSSLASKGRQISNQLSRAGKTIKSVSDWAVLSAIPISIYNSYRDPGGSLIVDPVSQSFIEKPTNVIPSSYELHALLR